MYTQSYMCTKILLMLLVSHTRTDEKQIASRDSLRITSIDEMLLFVRLEVQLSEQ